jgi:putative transposase
MKFLPQQLYHVYNQGNNQQNIFLRDVHFLYFLKLYTAYIVPHCDTLAWCLMHNHFHFMIATDQRCLDVKQQGGLLLDPVTNGFRKLLSAYAHEFNIKNNRSGALFRPKTIYTTIRWRQAW